MGIIYLIIARRGDYSDRNTWVVQALTDEAAAVEEAEKLNVKRCEDEALYEAYWKRRCKMSSELAEGYLVAEGRSELPTIRFYRISKEQQNEVEARIVAEIGEVKEVDADNYTVVAVPVGECGRWDLP